jgi:hypothetical protein
MDTMKFTIETNSRKISTLNGELVGKIETNPQHVNLRNDI